MFFHSWMVCDLSQSLPEEVYIVKMVGIKYLLIINLFSTLRSLFLRNYTNIYTSNLRWIVRTRSLHFMVFKKTDFG